MNILHTEMVSKVTAKFVTTKYEYSNFTYVAAYLNSVYMDKLHNYLHRY
jgi:hypothetical protein